MPDRPTFRLHAIALATASWLALAWTHAATGLLDRFGQLRGMDFLQFYAAGRLVAQGRRNDLYDFQAFAAELPRLVPGIGDLLFLPVYPPQLALLFAPLSGLSYPMALGAWVAASALLYGLAVALVLRQLPSLAPFRLEAWCFAIGFPPFVQLLAHGQIAALALLPLVGAFAAVRAQRPWLAGFALGLLAFKPQFATFGFAALIVWPSAGLLGGLLLAVVLQCLLVAAILGFGVLGSYTNVVALLLQHPAAFEPKVWAMHGHRATLELVLGRGPLATTLWIGTCAATLWVGRTVWARRRDPEFRFAVVVLAGLAINPHLYVYDLVLMSLPLACLSAAWVSGKRAPDRWAVWLAYSLVWLPLIGPVAALTRIQLTGPVIFALLWRLRHRM